MPPEEFTATVSSRSSKHTGSGPPGEREILQLNPQRAHLLQGATGWKQLEAGSLNLEADERILSALLDHREPDVFEPAESVIYPPQYADIPKYRKGYRYFRVLARSGEHQRQALLRRAVNPLAGRVELFADVHLRTALGVQDGDHVIVTLLRDQEGGS